MRVSGLIQTERLSESTAGSKLFVIVVGVRRLRPRIIAEIHSDLSSL